MTTINMAERAVLREAAGEKLTDAEYEAMTELEYAQGLERGFTQANVMACRFLMEQAGERFKMGDDDEAMRLRDLAQQLSKVLDAATPKVVTE